MKGTCQVCGSDADYSKNRCYEHEHYQEISLSGVCCPRCGNKEFWKFDFYDEWKYKCKYCKYETIFDGLEEVEKEITMSKEVESLNQVLNKLAELGLDKSNSEKTNQKIKEALLAVFETIKKLEAI